MASKAACAARLSLNDAHFILGQVEDRHQRFVHIKRALERAPHRHSGLLIPLSDDAVVLDVQMLLRAGSVFTFDDMRGIVPGSVHIAFLEQERFQKIIRVPDDRALAFAFFNAEDRRQRFIFNLHRGNGFAQLVLVRVSKQHNCFVTVIHLSVCEAGLIGNNELNVVCSGNVGGGDDGKFRPVNISAKCNGAYESARNRATDGGAVPHAFAFNVVHVPRAAKQLVHALFARDGSAYDAGCRMRAHDFQISQIAVRVEA